MAEVILPPIETEPELPEEQLPEIDKPTELSKVITVKFSPLDTGMTSTANTRRSFYTTDTDAWVVFEIENMEAPNGEYSLVLYNKSDGSIFQRTGDIVSGAAYYKIEEEEIKHAGDWVGQVVITLANGKTTTSRFSFNVAGHLLDGKDVRQIVIQDFETLMKQLNGLKDDAEIDFRTLKNDIEEAQRVAEQNELERVSAENERKQAELSREETYDSKVDAAIVGADVVTKVDDKVAELSPTIQNVTAQLAQKVGVGTKAELEDLSGTVLSAIEGGEGTSFNLLSIPQDKSVTPVKTDFLELSHIGKNLFNKDSSENVSGILKGDGTGLNTNNYYKTSHFIELNFPDPTKKYLTISKQSGVYSTLRAIEYCDSNMNFISGLADAQNQNLQLTSIPTNTKFFKFTYDGSGVGYQVEYGLTNNGGQGTTTGYEPYREFYSFSDDIDFSSVIDIPENAEMDEAIKKAKSIVSVPGVNKFNPSSAGILLNKQLNGLGGTLINSYNNNYSTSDYIETMGALHLTVSRDSGVNELVRAYEFYDENNIFVSGLANATGTHPTYSIPANAKKYRFSFDNTGVNYQVSLGKAVNGFSPYTEKLVFPQENSLFGKTLIFNGDSIPAGYFDPSYVVSYVQLAANALGMNLKNYSEGGSTIGQGTGGLTDKKPIVDRYTLMEDGDIIGIAGGSNDWYYNYNTPGTMASRDKTTIYGSLHLLCLGLLEKYPGKKVFFATPIKRSQVGGMYLLPTDKNANGITLKEHGEIIKEVCDYYSIPVLDLYTTSQMNPHIESQRIAYIPDGTHPNNAGHNVISKAFIGFLNQLV